MAWARPFQKTRKMATPDPESHSFLVTLVSGLGVAVTALATWAWNHTHKRIDNVDEKTNGKADVSEVNRHTDHIAKLFDKVTELSDKTEVRFTVMEKQSFERHIELLKAISSIDKKK